jgi:DNA polymerase zeta
VDAYGIPSKIYTSPWYSREDDAPELPREYAGLVFQLKGGNGIRTLEEWQSSGVPRLLGDASVTGSKLVRAGGWEYAGAPPSVKEIRKWLRNNPFYTRLAKQSVNDKHQVSTIASLYFFY